MCPFPLPARQIWLFPSSILSIASSLLSALSKSRDKDAPLRADEVFERMQASGIEADTVAWTILITIWSRSKLKNKEERVQQIFDRFGKNDNYLVLCALCISHHRVGCYLYKSYIIRMIASGTQPNAVTYTSLLLLWSNSQLSCTKDKVLEVDKYQSSTVT
jgi:hypothetical protein